MKYGLTTFLLFFIMTCDEKNPGTGIATIQDTTGVIIFKHAELVDVETGQLHHDMDVLVNGSQIAAIGKSLEIPDAFEVDCYGKFLMPGLADMHTHVYYETDLLPYLANGVTTVLNMGSPSSILTMRENVKTNGLLGPTIYASAFVDGAGSRGWVIRTPEEAVADVAQIKTMGWDFIKVYNSIKEEVFLSIQAEAAKNNLTIIGHGVRDPGMEFILSHGQVMVAHMEEYLYTHFNNSLNESLIPTAVLITKSNGTYVTPNLSAYEAVTLQWGNPSGLETLLQKDEIKYVSSEWKEFWKSLSYTSNSGTIRPKYDFLKVLTKQFHDAGIPLLLGSDSPYIPGLPNGFSIHDELRNMTGAGLSAFDAIESGTRIPGEFINKFVAGSMPQGIIKEGYKADLILLKANPLDNVENIKKRVGVMANGRWMSEEFLQNKLSSLAN